MQLKVDPHRSHVSDVEHHSQTFEFLIEGVLTNVQPQTEYEWRECLEALQEAKNSLYSVAGLSASARVKTHHCLLKTRYS